MLLEENLFKELTVFVNSTDQLCRFFISKKVMFSLDVDIILLN